ncbi:MAG: hypothetical protein ACSI46_03675 [Gloeotrichia echinulata DVL01]|jgi:hypothetical protein
MMLSDYDLTVLEGQGWLYKSNLSSQNIVNIGQQIGKPIPSKPDRNLTDLLLPKNSSEAPKGSLSSIYGLEEIPFHTDGAYHYIPPKYIILFAQEELPFSIRILDFNLINFSNNQLITLSHDVWIVKDKFKSFYASVLTNSLSPGKTILRYNKHCMIPCNKNNVDSYQILENKIKDFNYISLCLEPNSILILNNWRILHGRDKALHNHCSQGIIERLFLME